MSVNVPTAETPRELELKAIIAEKTTARDAMNAELETLQKELDAIEDDRVNKVKNALYAQYLVIVEMLVAAKQNVSDELLSQLTNADRERLGFPKSFAEVAGAATAPESSGNSENSGNPENSGNRENATIPEGAMKALWWILTYTIPLIDDSYRTEFYNPRIPGDNSRYATKLSELNAFLPTAALGSLRYDIREDASTTAHIAGDFVTDIAGLFEEKQDRATSEALQRITRLMFVGSLIRLTVEYLLTDKRTKPTMMKLINDENPFDLHVYKYTKKSEDEEPKPFRRGKGKKFPNKKH